MVEWLYSCVPVPACGDPPAARAAALSIARLMASSLYVPPYLTKQDKPVMIENGEHGPFIVFFIVDPFLL